MSITISFMDLRLADTLAAYNSIELLDPNMDVAVNLVLEQLGFDLRHAVEYIPSRHRSMSGKVAIDYQAVGEMNRDKKYNHLRDATLRTVVAGYTDASLAREMAILMGEKNTYRNDSDKWEDGSRAAKDDMRYYSDQELLDLGYTGDKEEVDEFDGEYIERDWEENLRKIKQLEELRDEIRGTE